MEVSEAIESRHSSAHLLQLGSRVKRLQGMVDDLLRFTKDRVQVALVLETLSINLVDVLGSGRPGGEPATGSDYFDTANRCIVARGGGKFGCDRFTCQFCS